MSDLATRKADIIEELRAVLDKHQAAIEMEVVSSNYLGTEERMIVTLPGIWKDGEEVAPLEEIDLGRYFDGDEE